jgi:hypothetical protein
VKRNVIAFRHFRGSHSSRSKRGKLYLRYFKSLAFPESRGPPLISVRFEDSLDSPRHFRYRGTPHFRECQARACDHSAGRAVLRILDTMSGTATHVVPALAFSAEVDLLGRDRCFTAGMRHLISMGEDPSDLRLLTRPKEGRSITGPPAHCNRRRR